MKKVVVIFLCLLLFCSISAKQRHVSYEVSTLRLYKYKHLGGGARGMALSKFDRVKKLAEIEISDCKQLGSILTRAKAGSQFGLKLGGESVYLYCSATINGTEHLLLICNNSLILDHTSGMEFRVSDKSDRSWIDRIRGNVYPERPDIPKGSCSLESAEKLANYRVLIYRDNLLGLTTNVDSSVDRYYKIRFETEARAREVQFEYWIVKKGCWVISVVRPWDTIRSN